MLIIPTVHSIYHSWNITGFVDMLRDHVPSPVANAANKIQHIYTGDLSTQVGQDMLACNPDGELVVHVTKLYPSQDASVFDAFGRVLSGTISNKTTVKVCVGMCGSSRCLFVRMFVLRQFNMCELVSVCICTPKHMPYHV